MLKLLKIQFKNLLSYGNVITEIDFDKINSLMITGKNGSGKSSAITETLFYGFYGKSYRKIPLPELVNNVNKKGLYVKLEFTVNKNNYIIERGIRPNILKLFKNGTQLKEGVSKPEFQKQIDDIIGIDHI